MGIERLNELSDAAIAKAFREHAENCVTPATRWIEDRARDYDAMLAAAPAASGGEYPGCSGDPASCPENEGHGCCKPNPARHVAIVCDWKDADPFPTFIEAEIGGKSVSLEWRDRPDGLKDLIVPVTAAPHPPSAASVSERARIDVPVIDEDVAERCRTFATGRLVELAMETSGRYAMWGTKVLHDALFAYRNEIQQRIAKYEALEQALTQQRGECRKTHDGIEVTEDEGAAIDFYARNPSAALFDLNRRISATTEADNEALNEALSDFEQDYLTDGNGYAPAETYRLTTEAFRSKWPDVAAAREAALEVFERLHGHRKTTAKLHAEFVIRSEASERKAETKRAPQPSADAVRELVKRWRAKAKHHEIKGDRVDVSADTSEWHKGMDEGVSDCADELESLLSAASGEKGVG